MDTYLVLDIETVAYSDNEVNKMEREKLEEFETDLERNQYKELFPLSPFTSKLFCLGLKDTESGKRWVLVNRPGAGKIKSPDENTKYVFYDSEEELFAGFWEWISKKKFKKFITFNGREFDMPYLMLRSAVLKVESTVNLMFGSEYNFDSYHIDLAKKLVFNKWGSHGPTKRYKLDYYLKVFGLGSSKTDEASGKTVSILYREGKYKEIIEYNCRDLDKTQELYEYLIKYLYLN